jgi:hypothetical protein
VHEREQLAASAAPTHKERRVRRPPQPSSQPTQTTTTTTTTSTHAEQQAQLSLKRNPGRLKSEDGNKQEPNLNFNDPKFLAALQKHKAPVRKEG